MKKIFLFALLFCASKLFSQNFNFTLRSQVPFSGEMLAGVWGYERQGREYALVAGEQNLHIIDVTDPDAPKTIVKLAMVNDWGKEVRTFRHFAYVSAESGAGLVIYDLSNLPSDNPAHYPKKEIDQAGGYTTDGHTLHIDTTAGVLYLNDGGNRHSWVFNLLPNPFSPVFAGFYEDLGGIHDGYADNDTLFAAHINKGFVAVVDMQDKSNPVVLSTFETPGKFPHNTWLTSDRRHLLAADEVSNGFLSCWDISDLEDVRETSRFRPTPGSGSVPHNAFIMNNYAFASWYRDGVILLDIARPENVIQVGRFDTNPRSGDGFEGSWGNYPFLPSGNVLVSDYDGGLFVLTPTYTRACYLEGKATDVVSKNPLAGVKVLILKGDQLEPPLTSVQGQYRTGQSKAGEFEVVFSKDGYRPLLRKVKFKPGEVTLLDVELTPLTAPGDDLPVLLLAAEDNQPLANIEAVFRNEFFQFQVMADAKGWAKVPIVYADSFDVFPAFWGRLPLKKTWIDPVKSPVVRLERGYYDDFHFDLGWVSEGDAESGFWERGILEKYLDFIPGPEEDVAGDLGDLCYLTDVRANFGEPTYDVSGGTVRLVSPKIDLRDFRQPKMNFQFWHTQIGTHRRFSVFLENEMIRKEIWSGSGNAFSWIPSGEIEFPDEAKTGVCNIVFEATDTTSALFFEVGLDAVEIRDSKPAPALPIETLQIEVFPNPFHDQLLVRCLLPEGDLPIQWQLFDVAGRQLLSGQIDSEAAVLELSPELASGVYFFHIQHDEGEGKTIKVVKF
jgi:choice-of-anchor B domain-containing protein